LKGNCFERLNIFLYSYREIRKNKRGKEGTAGAGVTAGFGAK
jgi:hypothetical protein